MQGTHNYSTAPTDVKETGSVKTLSCGQEYLPAVGKRRPVASTPPHGAPEAQAPCETTWTCTFTPRT